MIDDMWQIHVHIRQLDRRYHHMLGKNISISRLNAHVAKLKKRTKTHWKDLPSQVVQDVVLRYGTSRDAFFQNIEDRKAGLTNRKVGFPKIKPRQKYNSMTFTQAGYELEGNRIKINCIETGFSFHKHREINGVIKTLTLKRDRCGDYWICFSCETVDNTEPKSKTGQSAGFDYGNKTFLTSDAGDKIASPQFFKQSLRTLQSLNKALTRKVKGSGNWYRACRALARHHRKVARQREDWQWKLADELCTKFDILCFETLNLDGMKRLWGRKVSDHAFYQFLQILQQKCAKHGKPSSKSDNGLRQQNLAVIVNTLTKTSLFQIDSGHVPNVGLTTTGTSTLLSISNGQAWLPKVERHSDGGLLEKTAVARKHKSHALACGYH